MQKKGKAKKSPKKMTITILGSGTSVGVPMIGKSSGKQFKNPKNQRLRTSCLVEPLGRGGPAILIDTSPDLRQQALRYFPQKKPRLDAVLMTHGHADHLHGIDDIRPFNFLQRSSIPFYGEKAVLAEIKRKFSYIFYPTQIGGGLPQLSLESIHPSRSFKLRKAVDPEIRKLVVTPLLLEHGNQSCLGYRIGNFAYITDCSLIPTKTLKKLQGLELLILDCLREEAHSTHLCIPQSVDYAHQIQAKKTIFTHMNSSIEYFQFKAKLPARMAPAYDGMRFHLHLDAI